MGKFESHGKESIAMDCWVMAKLENDARNELHCVMGMLELIAEGPLAPSQANYLRTCRSSADRLLRTIQNVGVLLTKKPTEPQVSDFDLREILGGITGLMTVLAERKGLSFTCEVPCKTPHWVTGDRECFEDILFRLLDNAVRFTDHGGVRLVVNSKPVDARIWIQFDVCDTGPGIPQEVIASLANPVSEANVWHGLGLPIVRKLVAAMGGAVTIRPQELGGTQVSVSLPFEQPARPMEIHEPVEDDQQANVPLNILVAEDSDDCYYVLEACLGNRHRVNRAVDGRQAVEMFKAGVYDLVFMDIHMPGMDGYVAAHAIRMWESGGSRARVPIVVLSSDSPNTQLRLGAQAGCSAYLTKPVCKADLLRIVNRYRHTSDLEQSTG